MPLFEYRCPNGRVTERLAPTGAAVITCECGLPARRIPSAAVQLNPPTGAALRRQFGLYQEASQEIDHAYTKVETDLEQPVAAPPLWNMAKQRAKAILAAGEAPTGTNPLKE